MEKEEERKEGEEKGGGGGGRVGGRGDDGDNKVWGWISNGENYPIQIVGSERVLLAYASALLVTGNVAESLNFQLEKQTKLTVLTLICLEQS